MNSARRALVLAAFDDVLPQLVITEDGLDPQKNTYGAVLIAARIAAEVKTFAIDGLTPAELLLHRLAVLTEELLATGFRPPPTVAEMKINETINRMFGPIPTRLVKQWLLARAELVEVALRGQQ